VFGFTLSEWTRAFAFDNPDDEASRQAAELFARHALHGSEGFVFPHYDLLRLAYVSPDCRERALTQIGATSKLGRPLLEKFREMDADTRASGRLRHPPASAPL
jgi:hypothetical protein